MQPYNYSIDLPPPAPDTFLQDIMGIQQLKGLRQQQEISQQQAAFQKEMQPLERARAQAAIDAARASAGLTGVQVDAARENLTALKERNALVKSYQNKAFEMAKDPKPPNDGCCC